MAYFQVSDADREAFDRDGYLIVEDLFDAAEIDLLSRIARADKEKAAMVRTEKDTDGAESKLWLSSELDDSIYTAIARSARVAGTMDALLGDEVYLYHYKMMEKEAKVGGAWEWHQDYGYWYDNGCLYPDLGSVMIAVDSATQENGCLQVLKGSHRMGRIEHGTYGTQVGADPLRVAMAEEHLERIYCEMKPGTALFFHSNTLHCSDANESDNPRWTLICCYNTKHNPCEARPGHPTYSPLDRGADECVREQGEAQWQQIQATGEGV